MKVKTADGAYLRIPLKEESRIIAEIRENIEK
jgi:hypothetical protein